MKRIAACITPHGFGHATRTIAVLEALQSRHPSLEIVLFTTAPKHLFEESLKNITFHRVATDVGIVQHDALRNNIPGTITALDIMLQSSQKPVDQLAKAMNGCDAVICDISPMGILAADIAKIPSILIENFTWGWIYQNFVPEHPDLFRSIKTLSEIYGMVDYHIQVTPVCKPISTAQTVPPVFRKRRLPTADIRKSLDLRDQQLIVISMGGIDFNMPAWHQIRNHSNNYYILAGQPSTQTISDNCLALGRTSQYYHPDIVAAADLVICKSGYSTTAECYQAGTRICCITRPDFAESQILEKYIQNQMKGTLLSVDDFIQGRWIARLPEILAHPRQPPVYENGADTIAKMLLSI